MTSFLIKDAQIVDSGKVFTSDLLVKDSLIVNISPNIGNVKTSFNEIDASGKILIPGVIDVHVHFREPGLTKKADIYTESRAAAAGGVTSYMEMPNTIPNTVSIKNLKEKFELAGKKSMANYSFYLGATNHNLEEIFKAKEFGACGIKVFMGSSTGNMIVNDDKILERIFAECDSIIVVHSENEEIINSNLLKFSEKYGSDTPVKYHPEIRSSEACYKETSKAIEISRRYNTRLHIAHLSTEDELALLPEKDNIENKRITSEVCPHHLYFDALDYDSLGAMIKCNPAIKEKSHKKALLQALLDDKIDIISSDHAPHLFNEKRDNNITCPSGIPMIQHNLQVMLDFYNKKAISLEQIVEKMCHAPAKAYRIKNRGFIKEGYQADLVLIDISTIYNVSKSNIYYKCNWSPFEDKSFNSEVTHTFINGKLVYDNGIFNNIIAGEKLIFS
jgi:dihydroorotase